MSQTASLWQQQCKIMERFNFEKVQRTMLALGWRWRRPYTGADQRNC